MPRASATRRSHCVACWRTCAYADFRGTVPTTLKAKGSGVASFEEVGSDQQAELTQKIRRREVGGVTRHTILGELYRRKRTAWDKATTECYYRGQDKPRTTDEALVYAERLSGQEFRVRHLGMTLREAREVRRSITLAEFLSWWRTVGKQTELDVYVGGEDLAGLMGGMG